MHSIFNYTLTSYNETSVRLHRQWINTTSPDSSRYLGADLYLTVPVGSPVRLAVTPGDNGTWTPPTVDIIVPASADPAQAGVVTVKVVTNETSLPGLDTQRLFLPQDGNETTALQNVLQGLSDGESDAAKQVCAGYGIQGCCWLTRVSPQVSFLTYEDKFTAGGWRFLTVRIYRQVIFCRTTELSATPQYFGRDSLIALRLLMPTLTSEAIEAALGAVIERTNATGALSHEETIGRQGTLLYHGDDS